MSTNLNPPLAHNHDSSLSKSRNSPSLDGMSKITPLTHIDSNVPTDLSMSSALMSHGALRFNQYNVKPGQDPFTVPIRQSFMGLPPIPEPIPVAFTRFPGGHTFTPSSSMLSLGGDVKFINSLSARKDNFLRDLRQTPSPISIKPVHSPHSNNSSLCLNQGVPSMLPNYQASPDAMLSASVNISESEMLREDGFDIPVTSRSVNSADDNLLNAGPSSVNSNCSSLRPSSNANYKLFDDETSREAYSESGQDLRVSPHNLSNSSSSTTDSFTMSGMSSLDFLGKDKGMNILPMMNHNSVKAPNVPNTTSPSSKGSKGKGKTYAGKSSSINCPICGKIFSNSSALTKHKLTHSDERKYVCQLCSKAFKRQDHLNGHMLTHRTKKPFECKVEGCGKSYCDARSLRRHNENHHSHEMNIGLLNNDLLLKRIQLASRTGQLIPDTLTDSATTQLKLLAGQGEHGITPSRLQNALLGLQTQSQDPSKKLDEDPTTAKLIEQLQQNPKLWAQLTSSGYKLDAGSLIKSVSCSICHKNFKNMPALNGHMRLHGGYFKKENEFKKEAVEKKPEVSNHSSTPLQTASSSVRALIEEKINQRKHAASLALSSIDTESKLLPGSVASGSYTPAFDPMRSGAPTFSHPSTASAHVKQSYSISSPQTSSIVNSVANSSPIMIRQEESFTPPTSIGQSYQNSSQPVMNEMQLPDDKIKDENNYDSSPPKFELFDLQQSSPNMLSCDQQADACNDESMDYSQIEHSVQLNSENNDVFMSASELKQTLEELKKEFMMPQAPIEKFRRRSDSDHFIAPKAYSSAANNQTIADQLRRKALTQRRTYRLSSDPGGDPFCDIPEQPEQQNAELPLQDNDQLDTNFFHSNHDQQMEQFSNPNTPTQTNVSFFPVNQMERPQNQIDSHHQSPRDVQPQHNYVAMQTEQISAPNTATQPHGSFFPVTPQHPEQINPSTPTQTSVGFIDNLPPQHEPMSNPCTPTQPNVGFFQSQPHHGHMSMPSTPTQQNTTFFSSHTDHFSNMSSSNQQRPSFFAEDHQAHTSMSNENYYQEAQNQSQFSVPTTLTPSEVSYFHTEAQKMTTSETPRIHPQPPPLFSYPSQNQTSFNDLPLHQQFDHSSFQYAKPNEPESLCKDSDQEMTSLDENDLASQHGDVFPNEFTSALEDDAFISSDHAPDNPIMNYNIHNDKNGNHAPAISISDSLFKNIGDCSSQATSVSSLEICSRPTPSLPSTNLLLTIPKTTQNVENSNDVFISPSSLPTSPVRIKRKHRPEPLFIPPHVNTCGFQSRLRSPRLWDPFSSDKKQLSPPPYTPPPMLSPVRSGAGLFWHVLSSSGSITPKSAPITPRFTSVRKSSSESVSPVAEEAEPPETDIQPHVNIGPQFQAHIPHLQRSRSNLLKVDDKADLIWDPTVADQISEEEMEDYLEFSCTSCVVGSGRNKEYALHLLQATSGDVQEALFKIMLKKPLLPKDCNLLSYQYPETTEWTPEEVDIYHHALGKSEKDFFSIAKEIKSKSVKQCVEFYYIWKKICPDEYKRLRTIRRKREQDNIFYSLRSKGVEDNDSATPKSDSRSATPDKDSDGYLGDKYSCDFPECSATFASKQALNGHVRIHGGTRSVSPHSPASKDIEILPQKFVNGNPNPVQNIANPEIDIAQQFPCKICGKVFSKVKSRSAHMKKHRQTEAEKRLRIQENYSLV